MLQNHSEFDSGRFNRGASPSASTNASIRFVAAQPRTLGPVFGLFGLTISHSILSAVSFYCLVIAVVPRTSCQTSYTSVPSTCRITSSEVSLPFVTVLVNTHSLASSLIHCSLLFSINSFYTRVCSFITCSATTNSDASCHAVGRFISPIIIRCIILRCTLCRSCLYFSSICINTEQPGAVCYNACSAAAIHILAFIHVPSRVLCPSLLYYNPSEPTTTPLASQPTI